MRFLYCASIWASLTVTHIVSGAALAESGKLPRGKLGTSAKQEPGTKAPAAKQGPAKGSASSAGHSASGTKLRPTELAVRPCHDYLANPIGGEGWFYPKGKRLLFLVSRGAIAEAKVGPKRYRFTLAKVNLESGQIEPGFSFNHQMPVTLVVHQAVRNAPQAVSALAFYGDRSGCYAGAASRVSVSLASDKGVKAVRGSGHFYVVRSAVGSALANIRRRTMLAWDYNQFQSREIAVYSNAERPLFFDEEKGELVTWSSSPLGLVRYSGKQLKKGKRLKLRYGDLVSVLGRRLALVRRNEKRWSYDILEIPHWSHPPGKEQVASTLKLSRDVKLPEAAIDLHLDRGWALVRARTPELRRQWRRVMLYDFRSSLLLSTFRVRGQRYLNFGAISPSGRWAVIEERHAQTEKTMGLHVFDFATGRVKVLPLAKLE